MVCEVWLSLLGRAHTTVLMYCTAHCAKASSCHSLTCSYNSWGAYSRHWRVKASPWDPADLIWLGVLTSGCHLLGNVFSDCRVVRGETTRMLSIPEVRTYHKEWLREMDLCSPGRWIIWESQEAVQIFWKCYVVTKILFRTVLNDMTAMHK